MGDRLSALRDLADTLEASIHAVDAHQRAPLAAQYRATLAEIAELESETGKAGDPVDEIAARRSARGGATARVRRTQGGAS